MTEVKKSTNEGLSRRNFLKVGSAAVAGSALTMCSGQGTGESKIRKYRMLGRTGFKASDVGLGGLPDDANVVRYAYDKGINYFDTAESYGRGEAENRIGGAMEFIDRKKVFITTKIHFPMEETEEKILERYSKCLERMKTDYADALYIHAVDTVDMVDHAGFHSAVNKLKADGRVRFAGLSCHGPEGDEGDSMEKILVKAAEDGRFDLMLLVYNFMNKDEGEKVIDACKKNDVGVTIMKSSPGVVVVDTWDPESPTEEQTAYIERMVERGRKKEEAIERIKQNIEEQQKMQEKTIPFAEKHGIKTNEKLRMASLQWVLNNPKVATVCMGLGNFDGVDKFVPLSGTRISAEEEKFLHDYQLAYNSMYCRHGCTQCVEHCAHKLPVSTIMRYSYYFEMQGRQKYAMEKYAALNDRDALHCFTCTAPCSGSCPHGVNIQANLLQAHSLLSLV